MPRTSCAHPRQRLPIGAETVRCTASLGAVNLDADMTSDQDVLVAADIATYDAEGAGGDRACVGGPVLRLS